MTASCFYDGKSKTEARLPGSDPHGAIQIRSFGGKMKIVNLWLIFSFDQTQKKRNIHAPFLRSMFTQDGRVTMGKITLSEHPCRGGGDGTGVALTGAHLSSNAGKR
jgi:hypothetical protein